MKRRLNPGNDTDHSEKSNDRFSLPLTLDILKGSLHSKAVPPPNRPIRGSSKRVYLGEVHSTFVALSELLNHDSVTATISALMSAK